MSWLNVGVIACALLVCLAYLLAWLGLISNPHPLVGACWTANAAFWAWMQGRSELHPPVRRSQSSRTETVR